MSQVVVYVRRLLFGPVLFLLLVLSTSLPAHGLNLRLGNPLPRPFPFNYRCDNTDE